MGFTGFHWVNWVIWAFIRFYSSSFDLTAFSLFILDFIGFHWLSIELYGVLLDLPGLNGVRLCLNGFSNEAVGSSIAAERPHAATAAAAAASGVDNLLGGDGASRRRPVINWRRRSIWSNAAAGSSISGGRGAFSDSASGRQRTFDTASAPRARPIVCCIAKSNKTSTDRSIHLPF